MRRTFRTRSVAMLAVLATLALVLVSAVGARDAEALPPWTILTLDDTLRGDGPALSPSDTSIALDPEGHPHISYQVVGRNLSGTSAGSAVSAIFDGTYWSIHPIGSSSRPLGGDLTLVGSETEIVVDDTGLPQAIYWDSTFRTVNYGSFDSGAGRWSSILAGASPVFDSRVQGQLSLAIGPAGRLHAAYATGRFVAERLMHAVHDGTTWTIGTVDGPARAFDASIAVDRAGNPHIAYFEGTTGAVQYTSYDGASWSTTTIDPDGGRGISLVLDDADVPSVAYTTSEGLEFATFEASTWSSTIVEPGRGNIQGSGASLAIDRAGRPHIAYYIGDGLRYAIFDGSTWSTSIVDRPSNIGVQLGEFPSLALDDEDHAHISYYDNRRRTLKYATTAPTNFAPNEPFDWDDDPNTVAENAATGDSVGVTARAFDVNGDQVTYSITTIFRNGGALASGAFAIDPVSGKITVADATLLDGDQFSQSYYGIIVEASDGAATSSTTFAVLVTNVAPAVTVADADGDPDDATVGVQYSDPIPEVTITAQDVAGDPLGASLTAPDAGTLADGLTLNETGGPGTGSWTLSGVADLSPGAHTVTVSVSDDDGGVTDVAVTVNVSPEDAEVTFDATNPTLVTVPDSAGSASFDLAATVVEAPDGAPGAIDAAGLTMMLSPIGPGSPVEGTCAPTGAGSWSCSFVGVAPNGYVAEAAVGGGFYSGAGQHLVVVGDPAGGRSSGGGAFFDTNGDRVTFGHNTRYQPQTGEPGGSFDIVRHAATGDYQLEATSIDGLAAGTSGDTGWAVLVGTGTYLTPGSVEPVGGYGFVAYVEDGPSVDRIWIGPRPSMPAPVELTMAAPAGANAVTLDAGRITVRE